MNAGYNEGMSVVLGKEGSKVLGERFTEGLWNGKQFEIAGKRQAREIDYFKGLNIVLLNALRKSPSLIYLMVGLTRGLCIMQYVDIMVWRNCTMVNTSHLNV